MTNAPVNRPFRTIESPLRRLFSKEKKVTELVASSSTCLDIVPIPPVKVSNSERATRKDHFSICRRISTARLLFLRAPRRRGYISCLAPATAGRQLNFRTLSVLRRRKCSWKRTAEGLSSTLTGFARVLRQVTTLPPLWDNEPAVSPLSPLPPTVSFRFRSQELTIPRISSPVQRFLLFPSRSPRRDPTLNFCPSPRLLWPERERESGEKWRRNGRASAAMAPVKIVTSRLFAYPRSTC